MPFSSYDVQGLRLLSHAHAEAMERMQKSLNRPCTKEKRLLSAAGSQQILRKPMIPACVNLQLYLMLHSTQFCCPRMSSGI
jgi:hypothetical protein